MENDRYDNRREKNAPAPFERYEETHPSRRNVPEATPGQKADILNSEALVAKSGDAPKLHDLSSYVNDLRQAGNLNSVADALDTKDGARVIRDENGQVKELVFDTLSAKPVDVKITNGDVSVNGHSSKDIEDANKTYTKEYCAERVKNDDKLSPEAKEHVTNLENALIDGDAKSVMAGIKALHGHEDLARDVFRRLGEDMEPTSLSWEADGKGGGTVKIENYGIERSRTSISTDGRLYSEHEDLFGKPDGHTLWAEKLISDIGKQFGGWQAAKVDNDRSVLNSNHYIDDKTSVSPQKLADESKAWEKSLGL